MEKYPQGFSKQKLYNTIKGESAFNTSARNKNTNASGLFQFTQPLDDINKKFGTNHTLQGVRGMSATEQLGVYDQYLERWNYNGSNELGIMQHTSVCKQIFIRSRLQVWVACMETKCVRDQPVVEI